MIVNLINELLSPPSLTLYMAPLSLSPTLPPSIYSFSSGVISAFTNIKELSDVIIKVNV